MKPGSPVLPGSHNCNPGRHSPVLLSAAFSQSWKKWRGVVGCRPGPPGWPGSLSSPAACRLVWRSVAGQGCGGARAPEPRPPLPGAEGAEPLHHHYCSAASHNPSFQLTTTAKLAFQAPGQAPGQALGPDGQATSWKPGLQSMARSPGLPSK